MAGAVFGGWIPLNARVAVAEPICNVPDTKPHLVSQALPILRRAARAGGPATGMVSVDVSLDERSRVTGTSVSSSTNPALDAAVVTAARNSTFRTQVTDCHPVASTFYFVITVAIAPASSDIRTGVAPSQPRPETAAASPQPQPVASASPSPVRSNVSAAPSAAPSPLVSPNVSTPSPSAGG